MLDGCLNNVVCSYWFVVCVVSGIYIHKHKAKFHKSYSVSSSASDGRWMNVCIIKSHPACYE